MEAWFDNTIKTEWVDGDPRIMRIFEDSIFTDKSGKEWPALDGRLVDGASIPRILWSVEGSPFVGLHRVPSVYHDIACEDKTEPHELVHQMFYEACIASGMDEFEAKKKYLAVALFGPKWDVDGNSIEVPEPDDDEILFFEEESDWFEG